MRVVCVRVYAFVRVCMPSMLSAVSLLLVSAHLTLCLPFIDAIINNVCCACENIEKI